MVTVSTPGKLILFGEHAVVYGTGGIAAAIGRRCQISVQPFDRNVVESPFSTRVTLDAIDIVKEALNVDQNLYVKIDSSIPIASGLGSSAALSVALSGALHQLTGRFDLESVNKVAYEVEEMFHGKPSGIDNTTCCYGGAIYYRKPNFQMLKIPKLNVLLAYTKRPKKSTRELVSQVAELDPSYRDPIIREIGHIVEMAKSALINGDEPMIAKLIDKNQELLKKLGVSSPEIDELVDALKGAASGKLCGAGGGGVVWILPKDREKTIEILESLGYKNGVGEMSYWEEMLGEEGVRIEEK